MKVRLGWINFNFYPESKTSFAIFVVSGLKDIFQWWAYLLILSRSLFSFFVVSLTSLTTEDRDVLSANSLSEQDTSEERSFI